MTSYGVKLVKTLLILVFVFMMLALLFNLFASEHSDDSEEPTRIFLDGVYATDPKILYITAPDEKLNYITQTSCLENPIFKETSVVLTPPFFSRSYSRVSFKVTGVMQEDHIQVGKVEIGSYIDQDHSWFTSITLHSQLVEKGAEFSFDGEISQILPISGPIRGQREIFIRLKEYGTERELFSTKLTYDGDQ